MDKKLKREDWLKIAALVLLILGVMCFVGAMVSALDSAFEYAEDVVEKEPVEGRDLEDYFAVIMFTMSGIVSIVWSVVLFIVSHIMARKSIANKTLKTDMVVSSEDYYVKEDKNTKSYCVYCGNKIMEDGRMCPNCGAVKDIEE